MKYLFVFTVLLVSGLHYATELQNAVQSSKMKRVQMIENIVSGV